MRHVKQGGDKDEREQSGVRPGATSTPLFTPLPHNNNNNNNNNNNLLLPPFNIPGPRDDCGRLIVVTGAYRRRLPSTKHCFSIHKVDLCIRARSWLMLNAEAVDELRLLLHFDLRPPLHRLQVSFGALLFGRALPEAFSTISCYT